MKKKYSVQVKKTITLVRNITVEVEEHESSQEAEFQARGLLQLDTEHHWTDVDESEISFTAVHVKEHVDA